MNFHKVLKWHRNISDKHEKKKILYYFDIKKIFLACEDLCQFLDQFQKI